MENMFALPGLERLLEALTVRDYPLGSGIKPILRHPVMTINLLIVILYGYLDPRCSADETAQAATVSARPAAAADGGAPAESGERGGGAGAGRHFAGVLAPIRSPRYTMALLLSTVDRR